MSPPNVASGPQDRHPESRPQTPTAAATPPPQGPTTICIVADVLLTAADLVASQGDREHLAYERGVLFGFGRGWEQRGDYERGRSAA
jgi:hypothetical protein